MRWKETISMVSWKPSEGSVSRRWERCAISDAAERSNKALRIEYWIYYSRGYCGSLTRAVSL